MAPIHWIQQLLTKEEKVGRPFNAFRAISSSCRFQENSPPVAFLNNFMTELKTFRQSLRKLYSYDWVCVPLVYTQVGAEFRVQSPPESWITHVHDDAV